MRSIPLALALMMAGAAALAQNPQPGTPPGKGAGNPPSGWSGGATPPQSDTGKMHPDGKGAPAAPSVATNPPPTAGDLRIASESEARKAIEAEGFVRVSGLKRDADGAWSGRAMRGTSNVAVRVDQRGNVSAE